ncbi:MAG: transcriptional regulator, TetR family [Nocardia sp.]|uniref:TetR/AcrR family transcriptional regulator n=1 Tax=Nocardia sp. TaxID=1821 RepID=UPI0026230DC2|nr:TetR/AcrR family transcriptional regulator [Nocardia sp.]MCU1647403.1 transcriptional regulator, TetR family [Nocardia sp.]
MSPDSLRDAASYPKGKVPRAVREKQILAIATTLFAEKGYAGTSMEDIVRAAGVSRPIVYDIAGSKADLYRHVFEHAAAELDARIRLAVSESSDLITALRTAIAVMFEHADTDPEVLSFVMTGTGDPELDRTVATIRDRTRREIAEVLTAAVHAAGLHTDERRIEALVHAVHGACEYAAHWRTIHAPELAMPTLAGWMTAFIEPGIQALVEESRTIPPS